MSTVRIFGDVGAHRIRGYEDGRSQDGQKPKDRAPAERCGEDSSEYWTGAGAELDTALENRHVLAAFPRRCNVPDGADSDRDNGRPTRRLGH